MWGGLKAPPPPPKTTAGHRCTAKWSGTTPRRQTITPRSWRGGMCRGPAAPRSPSQTCAHFKCWASLGNVSSGCVSEILKVFTRQLNEKRFFSANFIKFRWAAAVAVQSKLGPFTHQTCADPPGLALSPLSNSMK